MVEVAAVRVWWKGLAPRWILLAAWLVAIAYAYPGYLNWDSGDQIFQARTGRYEDWHPPVMAYYWHLLEYLVRGPLAMLLVQTSLFLWGLYAALRIRFAPRTAAWVASALFLFPPILTPMAAVWKDAQMAAFLVAGTMLALRRPWRTRIAGVALLFLAAAVRDNGAAALPPLCVLVVASWLPGKRLVALGGGAALVVALAAGALVANRALTVVHVHPWYKTVAIHDIAGTLCRAEPMTDDQVRAELAGIPLLVKSELQGNLCLQYNTRAWFALTFGDNDIFDQDPDKSERLARKHAWSRVAKRHPMAWLSHRWAMMREVLGLTDQDPWEPVCQTIAATPEQLSRISYNSSLSSFQQGAGAVFRWVAGTILYRPWAYLVLGLALLGYAIRRRDGCVAALITSGILYESTYFLGAAAPDYRYSHWLVTTVCLAAAITFGERWRRGRGK